MNLYYQDNNNNNKNQKLEKTNIEVLKNLRSLRLFLKKILNYLKLFLINKDANINIRESHKIIEQTNNKKIRVTIFSILKKKPDFQANKP